MIIERRYMMEVHVTVRSRNRANAERTRATRERVLAAATPLLVRNGYLETTMSGLARAAGVAVQTLYLSFGSKVAVLEAALVAAAADAADPASGPDVGGGRGSAAPGGDPKDGPSALAEHVRRSAAVVERAFPLAAVLRAAAADPEPAELLDRTRAAAFATHAKAVDELAEWPGFTDRLS